MMPEKYRRLHNHEQRQTAKDVDVGAGRQTLATVRRSGSCLGQFYCNALWRFGIDDSDPNVREFSFKL